MQEQKTDQEPNSENPFSEIQEEQKKIKTDEQLAENEKIKQIKEDLCNEEFDIPLEDLYKTFNFLLNSQDELRKSTPELKTEDQKKEHREKFSVYEFKKEKIIYKARQKHGLNYMTFIKQCINWFSRKEILTVFAQRLFAFGINLDIEHNLAFVLCLANSILLETGFENSKIMEGYRYAQTGNLTIADKHYWIDVDGIGLDLDFNYVGPTPDSKIWLNGNLMENVKVKESSQEDQKEYKNAMDLIQLYQKDTSEFWKPEILETIYQKHHKNLLAMKNNLMKYFRDTSFEY